MKRTKPKRHDELRPEYKHSDFGALVRGKYAGQMVEENKVVVLEPEVAKVSPGNKAVNEALGVIKTSESTARPAPSTARKRVKAGRP